MTLSSVDAASWDNPESRLVCDLCDQIEISVIVQDRHTGSLGHSGNDEIGQLSAFVTGGSQLVLNVECTVKVIAFDVDVGEDGEALLALKLFNTCPSAEPDFQACHSRAVNQALAGVDCKRLSDAGDVQARGNTGID